MSESMDPSFPVPDGAAALWWLGQAGFALRSGSGLLLIDPYLSDVLAEKYRGKLFPHTRMVQPPVDPARIPGITAVLCTHGHTDHMDFGAIPLLQSSSDPIFVVPRSETAKAVERGVKPQRLVGLDAGERFQLSNGWTISALPAAHEDIVLDSHGQNLFLGYVIDIGALRIYHSGDCVPYAGQIDLIRDLAPDIALLPVNGRDSYRLENGVPGNFHWDEALELCRSAGIPQLVCHHWGMFDTNTIDPRELADHLSGAHDVAWTIPQLGERIVLTE